MGGQHVRLIASWQKEMQLIRQFSPTVHWSREPQTFLGPSVAAIHIACHMLGWLMNTFEA